ncbi:hypothetical protein [Streptomyces sp. 8L]|uniref:hypothetical protein n=1 Tax=Streptomyces sp. 8L TaxID=2877242 RepID=UPI001CD1B48F|nr:hypothetical protein [Streptomyces sp. 8L]MCA1218428.1 hypothetical protein [Streptomyces sp. 8L]
MGATFFVSADRESGAAWTFTDDELSACVTRLWPGSRLSDGDGILELAIRETDAQDAGVTNAGVTDAEGTDVRDPGVMDAGGRETGRVHPFAWQTEHRVLTFPDQDPLDGAARIVHRLLSTLAPDVPAVWWADYDADLEPVDLSLDETTFAREFGG